MVLEVSEQELTSEVTDGEKAEAPVQPEEEASQEEFVGEATRQEEEKMADEQETQREEAAEAQHEQHEEHEEHEQHEEHEEHEQHEQHENQEGDDGFELGGEEEGYVVQDEISEGGLPVELEDEGLEVAEEEKNDE